jgi:hypothetical protein
VRRAWSGALNKVARTLVSDGGAWNDPEIYLSLKKVDTRIKSVHDEGRQNASYSGRRE